LTAAGYLLFGRCSDIFEFLSSHGVHLLLCGDYVLAYVLEIRWEFTALDCL